MRTGNCRCGNRIYFNNHHCLSCSATLGRCSACGALSSFTAGTPYMCDFCGEPAHACLNQSHQVCHSFNVNADTLCKWCEFTEVIPSLCEPKQVARWASMESAKRRLLLQLEELGLPPFADGLRESHPLRFQFLEDTLGPDGEVQRVTTGHENGLITINLSEADSVHRERMRVQLHEPQRTLIGHMRHEIGHYIDWAWASRVAMTDYHRLFGNPEAVDYGEALQRHYSQGAPDNWADHHVSAYATMHPWEDFAETVNVYLDIMAIATTASDIGGRQLDLSPDANACQLVSSVLDIVIEVSEYNFDLGLSPLLPERLPPAVIEKLEYVHGLRSAQLAPTVCSA